jgi:hypothetical protein
MGVGQKKKLAKHYTEQMDVVRTEEIEQQSTLGTKDIESRLTLDCERTDITVTLTVGRKVRLLDLKEECVEVFISGRKVGIVSSTGSAILREKHGISLRKGRSFGAIIIDVSEFTESFTVSVG